METSHLEFRRKGHSEWLEGGGVSYIEDGLELVRVTINEEKL